MAQGVALLGFIAVAPSMRGNGIAQPFLRNVVTAIYKDARIALTEINVYTFHHAAMRTYERLEFFKEGVRRSLAKMGDERWDAAHRDRFSPISIAASASGAADSTAWGSTPSSAATTRRGTAGASSAGLSPGAAAQPSSAISCGTTLACLS